MTAASAIDWCVVNYATVEFLASEVRVTAWGQFADGTTLSDAIRTLATHFTHQMQETTP